MTGTRDGEGPRKGDRVRVTYEAMWDEPPNYPGWMVRLGQDAAGHERWADVPEWASVEVLERADDPSKALRGEVREIDGMSAVCYGGDFWVYFSEPPGSTGGYGVYRAAQMVGAPVIGAVPGTPAADAQAVVVTSDAKRAVGVVNEPHGLPTDRHAMIAASLAAGRKPTALVIAMEAGLSREAAESYVEGMSEYQSYLSEHGETRDADESRRVELAVAMHAAQDLPWDDLLTEVRSMAERGELS